MFSCSSVKVKGLLFSLLLARQELRVANIENKHNKRVSVRGKENNDICEDEELEGGGEWEQEEDEVFWEKESFWEENFCEDDLGRELVFSEFCVKDSLSKDSWEERNF
jgi:hypothetical protein